MGGNKRHKLFGDRSKLFGKHTTISDIAYPFVKTAQQYPEVTGIKLGYFKRAPGGNVHFVKFFDTPEGLRLKIRGSTSIQELFVETLDREATRRTLAEIKF